MGANSLHASGETRHEAIGPDRQAAFGELGAALRMVRDHGPVATTGGYGRGLRRCCRK